jgi:hypothetical protein
LAVKRQLIVEKAVIEGNACLGDGKVVKERERNDG